jgi:pimeloyl-ACP methyl ester carboxylesterase
MAPVARGLSRHCGVLEPLQTARTVVGQVEELREALAEHARIPAILIGYSWGAWLSLMVAAQYAALVEKLILVSSGPLTEAYVREAQARRLDRLADTERAEYRAAIASLGDPSTPDSDHVLERLGRLAAKADAYDPIAEIDAPDEIRVSGEIYFAVWTEASLMRRYGELLRRARMVKCPVVAIHGDADPHPAAGVSEPLSAALPDFRLITLARCGRERYAKEEFYRILLSEIG